MATEEKKVCTKCGRELTLDQFYQRSEGGLRSQCKDCCKAASKENRTAHAEERRAYDRDRAMTPKRIACRKAYAATDAGRASRTGTKRRWVTANRGISRAEAAARRARDRGELTPTPCVCCGATEVVAHHPDYSMPLNVVWLCGRCHAKLHAGFARQLREERLPTAPRVVK